MAQNHYDILELKKDCSTQDIRCAFIKLSKQHHPDTSGSPKTNHFVKINEAYSILSKPDLRREYDVHLRMKAAPVYTPGVGYQVFKDDNIFRPGHGFDRAADRPYYGIKGLKKISNKWIVLACFVFTGLGVGLQVFAIRKSFAFSRETLDRKSLESYKAYQQVRERATSVSKDEQLDRIKQVN
ncbi:dnaJ-like protein 60 [Neocloeon triangulifer]|uniref:dnaJ-like protein 60 n=1 Tax=Neocloeon triangulifer TaxID=2078957 RepID=UPI00286F39A5|nr:dnaJ-like protein 60 [Neocloeon triangulifer]